MIYSTFLGGTTSVAIPGDDGNGVAVDSANNAYITGTTTSSDFPVTASTAFEATAPTGITNGAVFVTKVNTATTGAGSFVYSTFLSGGTTNGDAGLAIALKPVPDNIAYVTGSTRSGFVTTAGAPSTSSALPVVFVTEVDTSKTGPNSVPYSAKIGGSGGNGDEGLGIRVDAVGNIYVGGKTGSVNFPTTPGALQPTELNAVGDTFVFKLNPGGNGTADLLYSTYFGGSNGATSSVIRSLALDSTNNVYVTGQTSDTDFPHTTGAFQTSLTQSDSSSTGSGFVSKLTLLPVLAFGSPCAFNLAVTPNTSCALAFSNQPQGTTSTAKTFVLTNNTSSNITLTTFPPATSGGNAADFASAGTAVGGTGACSATLAAGASCGIGVTFTPSTTGAETAALTVAYTYNNGTITPGSATQTVALTGTGVAAAAVVSFNPTPTLNFTTPQAVGTTSTALPVVVTNTGNINLTFTTAPSASGDFAVAGGTTCSTSAPVAPNGTCAINITFTPSAAGARSGTLTLTDSATGSPQTLGLTGTGTTAAPVASVSPSPVPFGGQLVTTTSAAQTVTVKNTGNAALNITGAPSLSGTNSTDFVIASGTTCTSGASVPANGTCLIMVTFTPPAAASGSRSAVLSIPDNAAGSPQTVTLTGTAWDFAISAQSITVTRGTNGSIPVTVTGVGGFTGSVTLSCTATIAEGSCTAPAPVNASAAGTMANVTIITRAATPTPASRRTPPVSRQQMLLVLMAMMLLLTLPVARRFRTRLSLAGAAALLVVVAGCSNPLPTPAGTDSVTITGSSGGLSHSTTATVTVKAN